MVEHAANGGPRPGDPSLSLQERLEAIDPRGKPMRDGLDGYYRPSASNVLPTGPEQTVTAKAPPAPSGAGWSEQAPSKFGAGRAWKREVMD